MSEHGPSIPPREAFRIELRPLSKADESLYCSLYIDLDTMAFIGPPLSPEQAARNFRIALRRKDKGSRALAVVEKGSGNTVGICGWQEPDEARRRVEVGMILTPAARAHRYSIEVLATVFEMAFATLPIDTVWVQYDPANAAADRLTVGMKMRPYASGVDDEARPARFARSIQRSSWQLDNGD